MDVYEKTDRLIARNRLETARQFNTVRRKVSGLADFDEINTLVKRLYFRLEEKNRKMYREIMVQEYRDCLEGEVPDEELDNLLFDIFESELDEILDDYDPVTGYVYTRETERKCERLFEKCVSLISHKEGDGGGILYPLNNELRQAFDRAFRLWANMTEEYAIRSHDRAREEAFHAFNVEKVVWRTENDRKVCKTCAELEDEVFPLDEVPDKPHLRCRCWIEPIDD